MSTQEIYEEDLEEDSEEESSKTPSSSFGSVIVIVLLLFAIVLIWPYLSTGISRQQGSSIAASGNVGSREYYVELAKQDARKAGIPENYFVRQINQESGFNPDERGGAGEIGIAQFLPSTATGLGINPYDPVDSLKGAAQLMGRHYRHYGDYEKALSSYNCGSGCTDSAIARCGIGWYHCIPLSTQMYIKNIMY